MIEFNPSRNAFDDDPQTRQLAAYLASRDEASPFMAASVYLKYPVYRDNDGDLVVPDVLLLSQEHGVIVFEFIPARSSEPTISAHVAAAEEKLTLIYGRLLQSRRLPKVRLQLSFNVSMCMFQSGGAPSPLNEIGVVATEIDLAQVLASPQGDALSAESLAEVRSIMEGTKGLRPSKHRALDGKPPGSRGVVAAALESEITSLDQQQKHGAIVRVTGPQRIRGLAGSGKTVVLAMKAALAHLENPDSNLLFTFHTKSLYQHIRYLITRSYRNRDYHDPNWSRLQVLHGWGGRTAAGVYYNACIAAGVTPISFGAAARVAPGREFDHVCAELLATGRVVPLYDLGFIDEAQDFPVSFIQLCAALVKERRFVLAYDEFQTIFQTNAPTAEDLLGPGSSFVEDIVLHKCYRNPRQIIVCAHALGLGLYSRRVVQLPENQAHWEDLGYEWISGECEAGSSVTVERPEANSPHTFRETRGSMMWSRPTSSTILLQRLSSSRDRLLPTCMLA